MAEQIRATSMSMADLRKHRIVAIAGGPAKVTALRGVLRSGVLHGLIIDEVTAKALTTDKPETTSGKTRSKTRKDK
jgi:DNA-binding transcriptional regulator LsrR (DeoR family)